MNEKQRLEQAEDFRQRVARLTTHQLLQFMDDVQILAEDASSRLQTEIAVRNGEIHPAEWLGREEYPMFDKMTARLKEDADDDEAYDWLVNCAATHPHISSTRVNDILDYGGNAYCAVRAPEPI